MSRAAPSSSSSSTRSRKSDWKVEKLTLVTNIKEDIGGDAFQTAWDPAGNLMAVKPTAKADLPQNAEQLRLRLKMWDGPHFHGVPSDEPQEPPGPPPPAVF